MMLLTRSFFNRGLLRSDLRRSGAALFLYVFVWLILLPMQIWRNVDLYETQFDVHDCLQILNGGISAAIWVNLFFGIAFAMIVFAYLMNTRAVCGLHSLPICRGCQFRTHLLSVLGSVLAANVLIFLLTVLAQSGGRILWGVSFYWLICSCVTFLLCFAMGILSCMLTGWLLAAPVLYGAMHALAFAVYFIVDSICSLFYATYAHIAPNEEGLLYWLTPVARVVTHTTGAELGGNYCLKTPAGSTQTLVIYTVAAIVLLIGSHLLYRLRHSEVAGNALAFRVLYPAARWCIGLLGAFGAGTILAAILCATEDITLLLVCQAGMGTIAFVLIQMLMSGTYRVLRKIWPELVAMCVLVLAIGTCMRLDVFGYETRVPEAQQVETVLVRSSMGNDFTMSKEENIAAAVETQQYLAHRESNASCESAEGALSLYYTMKDGSHMARSYTISDADTEAMSSLLNNFDFCRGLITAMPDTQSVTSFTYGLVSNIETGVSENLTPKQCRELYEAICADAQAIRITPSERIWYEYCTLSVYLEQTDLHEKVSADLRRECTNCLQLLQQWGYFDSVDEIFR